MAFPLLRLLYLNRARSQPTKLADLLFQDQPLLEGVRTESDYARQADPICQKEALDFITSFDMIPPCQHSRCRSSPKPRCFWTPSPHYCSRLPAEWLTLSLGHTCSD